MANITVGQIIMEVQRMASRVKDLDVISSSLLEQAEGNNRFVESLRQYQDDMDSLNRISNNKTNAEMVNRIQQQNAKSSEILKENRELKICIEDCERAMELIMKKYREHAGSKVIESKINLSEMYNEKLWKIIRDQREKISEMAAVMQRAASLDDEQIHQDLETMTKLRLENKALRELLQISQQFGSNLYPIRMNDHLLEEKSVQTECDDSSDELSFSGASIENANNNSVILSDTVVECLLTTKIPSDISLGLPSDGKEIKINRNIIDNAKIVNNCGDNNNGPITTLKRAPISTIKIDDNMKKCSSPGMGHNDITPPSECASHVIVASSPVGTSAT